MALIEHLVNDENRNILRHARLVDIIDRFTSVIGGTMQQMGPPWDLIGKSIEAAEIGLLKTPYLIRYLKATGHYEALPHLVSKEVFGFIVPFGDYIDWIETYYNTAKKFYEEQQVQKLK